MRHHPLAAIVALSLAGAALAQSVTTAAGPDAASILGGVNAFRTALGGGSVPGANGSFGGARREINWDGVPDMFSTPNPLPPTFFNANSPRGAVFTTPGSGFQVSASGIITPLEFANINSGYLFNFDYFSPSRLFTAMASTSWM